MSSLGLIALIDGHLSGQHSDTFSGGHHDGRLTSSGLL